MVLEVPHTQYKMQPKFSPEVNPSELVFSYLKGRLWNCTSIHDDLMLAITTILSTITLSMMIG